MLKKRLQHTYKMLRNAIKLNEFDSRMIPNQSSSTNLIQVWPQMNQIQSIRFKYDPKRINLNQT